jgi:hypothetical protein
MNPAQQADTPGPFAVKDCAVASIATGVSAADLRELRQGLAEADEGTVYYHFWGGLVRPRFDDPEFHNDFAVWARNALRDQVLAERLGIIDPSNFQDLGELRQRVLEVVDQRLEERGQIPTALPGQQFHFVRSQLVVFDTHLRLQTPEEMVDALPELSLGSVFYHFVDARRRQPYGRSDFAAWLNQWPRVPRLCCQDLAKMDPFFAGLRELRRRLAEVLRRHLSEEAS